MNVQLYSNLLFQAVTPNCPGTVVYRYRINNDVYKNTTSTTVEFYLDEDEPYWFAVQAVNTAGLGSDIVTTNGTSEKIGKVQLIY